MERNTTDSPGWALFSHEADIGVRGFGSDLPEAFSNVARAMTAAVTPLDGIAVTETIAVRCRAADIEILLVDWLNAVIYEMATRKMVFREFRVQIENGELWAELRGEPVDTRRHAPAVELKGATLTSLSVALMPDGRWAAQCVVDV